MDNPKIVLVGLRQVELREEPIARSLDAKQVLVRARYSLISAGTELAAYTGTHIRFSYTDERRYTYPRSLGYAVVGQVEGVGKAVSAFSPGDWVVAHFAHQRYAIVDQGRVSRLPDGVDPRQAVFVVMGNVADTAVQVSPATADDVVAVVGLGLVGNLAGQLYHHAGARVIGVDVIARRGAIARECGFDDTVNPQEADLPAQLRSKTGTRGADIVIEASGSPSAVPLALSLVREKGQVVLLGSTRGVVQELDVYSLIHLPDVTVKGAHARLYQRFTRPGQPYSRYIGEWRLLDMIARNELVISPLISDVVAPQDAQQAYENLLNHKESYMGVLIDWDAT